MKNKNEKRFGAFLIDLLIISLLFAFVYYFINDNPNVTKINQTIANINESLMRHEITVRQYVIEFGENIYQLDQERIMLTALNICLIILYFVIVPILTKGYTVGLYITGLTIKGNLSINRLLLRNLITTGLFYLIFAFILNYLLTGITYFIGITILGFIQFLLVITSTFMILYRKDRKGIQDIISHTSIVRSKEVEQ